MSIVMVELEMIYQIGFYQNVDLTPLGIIRKFNLFKLDLTETTNYGFW